MSIIIHVKKSSKEKPEEDLEIHEESIIEKSVLKRIKSTINKPITSFAHSNDLHRLDNCNNKNKPVKTKTIEDRKREVREFINTVKKCETDNSE